MQPDPIAPEVEVWVEAIGDIATCQTCPNCHRDTFAVGKFVTGVEMEIHRIYLSGLCTVCKFAFDEPSTLNLRANLDY